MKSMSSQKVEKISLALSEFIKKSPTAYHAVATIQEILEQNGYQRIREEEVWRILPGGRYYVTRNDSSIIAVCIGADIEHANFQIAAAHGDSPTFKLKEHAVLEVRKKYAQINTEGYGNGLCAPWLDRPLSIAGRVIVKENGSFSTRLLRFDRDLLLIPSLAIHMNRSVNDGTSYNKQIDMLPLLAGEGFTEEDFTELLAEEAGVSPEQIYGSDLYLYNRTQPTVWGARKEFLSAPKLDDLQCAFSALQGFLQGQNDQNINVYACFDNEEVGSRTKQGAASTFLSDTLHRIHTALGRKEEDFYCALASSFFLSCDNVHAVHPNHPEKADQTNCVFMNEGIVIKTSARQKYCSDAVSAAVFREICERAGVPVQYFANRSDMEGGGTLGNIAMLQVAMNCIDIGLPQLAMHSAYETTGVKDTGYMIRAITEFFNSHFTVENGTFQI